MISEGWEQEQSKWQGMVPDIFNSLAIKLNFTYTLQLPRDGKWGRRDEHGKWSGIVRDLMDEEADMAVTAISVTHARCWPKASSSSRSAVVDFGVSFDQDPLGLFVNMEVTTSQAWGDPTGLHVLVHLLPALPLGVLGCPALHAHHYLHLPCPGRQVGGQYSY